MADAGVRSGGLLRERMIIRRTAEMLVSALPPDVLFPRVCDLLASQFGAHFVAIVESRNAKLHVSWSFAAEGESPTSAFEEIDVDDIDPQSSSLHAVGTERVVLFVPLRYGAGCFGFLALGGGVRRFSPDHVALLETCARYMAVAIYSFSLSREKERLEALATRDALTGAHNRRVFDERFAEEWRRAGRSGEQLSLIMVDVDYFKVYNDTYGHVAGDHCLQQIVQALTSCVSRSGDVVARYGGEEFVTLLPSTPEQGAIDVAERMCKKVRDLHIVHRGSELDRVSISAGVATMVPSGDDRGQLLAASDAALYRAKENGRNRVATQTYIETADPARRRFEGRSNLPAQPTSFVGREAELATLARALPTSAVISILGPGGVGKTRLAVAAAQSALPTFPGGAWLVEVGAERDERRLPELVATAMGAGGSDGLDALLGQLTEAPALIILDSCEHLIDACRSVVDRIARRCPDSRIITTSRQPLEFPGELRLRLDPFAQSEAARLFVARARDVRPEFVLDSHDEVYVSEICRRVDCLPLAIELAAMRLGFMSLQQLAEHGALGNPADLHQRIAWGFDLLDAQERRFLARLSILPGPFDEEAAATIAGGEDAFGGSFELLTRLVEKSLVQVDLESGRYRLLTTIAEYVRLRLDEFDDPLVIRAAAIKHYAEVVAAVKGEREVDPSVAFARYGSIRENVETVLEWALAGREDVESGAAIAADMAPYWTENGRFSDARRFLELAAAQAGRLSRRRILDVLEAAVEVAAAGGDADVLETLAERLRVETGSSNDGAEVARVMLALGLARQARGRRDEALSLFHHAANAFRIASEPRSLARALIGWADILVEDKGDIPQALAMLDEALDAARAGGSTSLLLSVISEIAELWSQRGDESQAIEIIHDVAAQCQEFGDDASVAWTTLLLARAELRRDQIVARMHARDALERLRVYAHPGRLAAAFELCARIAIDAGELDSAARLLAFSVNLRHTHGVAGTLRERREIARLQEVLEAGLERGQAERAAREGRAMSLDAAVHRALGDGKLTLPPADALIPA